MKKRQKKANYNTKMAYCDIFEEYVEVFDRDGKVGIRLTKTMLYGLNFHRKQDQISNYKYPSNFIENLRYTSDRMNGGRARALLALYKKEMHL